MRLAHLRDKGLGLRRQRGFTIIELLIVVVVIATLTTISVVAYNGVQGRAKITQLTVMTKQWEAGLRAVESQTGSRPYNLYSQWAKKNGFPISSAICLGDIIDYPADASKNYKLGNCYGGFSWSPSLLGFTSYLEEQANFDFPSVRTGIYGRNIRGLLLTNDNELFYWAPGSECIGTDKVSSPYDGGVHCRRQL